MALTLNAAINSARFDAYTSTVYEEPRFLKDTLKEAIDEDRKSGENVAGIPTEWGVSGSLPFYDKNDVLFDQFGKRIFNVQYGGRNGTPLVQCTGEASSVIAATLRREWPKHKPSRIDSAIDYAAPGLFERHAKFLRGLARRNGLSFTPKGDWVTKDAGRTIELGSRRSQLMLRVYEKGLEMARKDGVEVTDENRHIVRCEIEFKPQNDLAREQAQTVEPSAMWGLSRWLGEFAVKAFNIQAELVDVRVRKEPDYERALRFMCRQYRAHLHALLDECGGDLCAFGEAIATRAELNDFEG